MNKTQDFVRLVDGYLDKGERYGQAESTAQNMARQGQDAQGLNSVLPDYFEEFQAARQAVLDAAMPLAEILQRNGNDPTGVLTLHSEIERQRDWMRILDIWRTVKPELQRLGFSHNAPDRRETTIEEPRRYLTNWRAILVALGMTNNVEDREKVRALNDKYDGPIVIPGRGSQPKADKAKLIEWWNGLELQWVTGGKSSDRAATVANQHSYGKSGIVVPDISGGIKKRRTDHKG